MIAWSRDEIYAPVAETWQVFRQRVLVASSGGAISIALSQVMGY